MSVRAVFTHPGSPLEDGRCEHFNGTLRNELLDGDTILTRLEAGVLIKRWRRE